MAAKITIGDTLKLSQPQGGRAFPAIVEDRTTQVAERRNRYRIQRDARGFITVVQVPDTPDAVQGDGNGG